MRQRLASERKPARHQKIANEAAHDCDDRSSEKSVLDK
jgi:hypothetical protein